MPLCRSGVCITLALLCAVVRLLASSLTRFRNSRLARLECRRDQALADAERYDTDVRVAGLEGRPANEIAPLERERDAARRRAARTATALAAASAPRVSSTLRRNFAWGIGVTGAGLGLAPLIALRAGFLQLDVALPALIALALAARLVRDCRSLARTPDWRAITDPPRREPVRQPSALVLLLAVLIVVITVAISHGAVNGVPDELRFWGVELSVVATFALLRGFGETAAVQRFEDRLEAALLPGLRPLRSWSRRAWRYLHAISIGLALACLGGAFAFVYADKLISADLIVLALLLAAVALMAGSPDREAPGSDTRILGIADVVARVNAAPATGAGVTAMLMLVSGAMTIFAAHL